jgi:hypothetical protein
MPLLNFYVVTPFNLRASQSFTLQYWDLQSTPGHPDCRPDHSCQNPECFPSRTECTRCIPTSGLETCSSTLCQITCLPITYGTSPVDMTSLAGRRQINWEQVTVLLNSHMWETFVIETCLRRFIKLITLKLVRQRLYLADSAAETYFTLNSLYVHNSSPNFITTWALPKQTKIKKILMSINSFNSLSLAI